MGESNLSVGVLVQHPNRPEWGPGKVVKALPGKAWVVWRDLPDRVAKAMVTTAVPLDIAPDQRDDVLDNLPPLVEENGTLALPRDRVTLEQAKASFTERFPLGFEDSEFLLHERNYKWEAHEKVDQALGGPRFRQLLETDTTALIEAVLRCEQSVNLLSLYEKAAFKDAIRSGQPALRYLTTLCDLLEADEITEQVFAPYADAVYDLPADRSRVATWPVATIIPFLAQPDRHLFLKPEVTQQAAEALGFHLNYQSHPNWLTYSRLLQMGRTYRDKLASLKPRDMIDVQSFFWVACGGYDREKKNKKLKKGS